MTAKDLTSIETNRLLGELEDLRRLCAESGGLSSSLAELTVELNHYKGEFTRLEEENTANLALNAKMADEYSQLQMECDEREKDGSNTLKSVEAELEEAREHVSHLARQTESLQQQHQSAEEGAAVREADLRDAVSAQATLQDALSAKAEEYKNLLDRFIAQKEEVVALTATAKAMADLESDSVVPADRTAAGRLAGLQDVIQGLEVEVEDLCAEKEELSRHYTAELRRVREDVEKLSADALRRDAELAVAREEVAGSEEGAVAPALVRSVSARLVKLGSLLKATGDTAASTELDLAAVSQTLMSPSDDAVSATLSAMDQYLEAMIRHAEPPCQLNQVFSAAMGWHLM
jgi:chromosome segregation ATPase